MTLLPILDRELRVTARRSSIYRNRLLVPAVLAAIIVLDLGLVAPPASAKGLGRTIYGVVSYLAFIICALEGARQTADCLSAEKREGTLGLLFLTDLNSYDVILGKLAAASLASFHALLAMVPILGCALFLGGVTPGEVWRIALALASLLSFSLAMGMWVSSRSQSASHAMGGTVVLLALALFAPWPLQFNPFSCLSPAWAFFGATDLNYTAHPLAYWGSLLLAQAFAFLLLTLAAVNIHRFREGEDPRKRKRQREFASASGDTTRVKRGNMLGVNPVYWLADFGGGSGIVSWTLACVAVAVTGIFLGPRLAGGTQPAGGLNVPGFYIMLGVLLCVHLTLKVFLASRACQCVAEARRNSTLELLLCTPLKVEDILRGQVLALKKAFLKPLLVVLFVEIIAIYWMLSVTIGIPAAARKLPVSMGDILIGVEVAYVLFFLLDLQGVVWTGFWFGLCSKNESTATFKTIFYVILLPVLLLVLYCLGMILFVVWPLVAYVWSRLQLQEHFRHLAGQRLIASGNLTGWLPLYVPNLPENAAPD